MPTYVRGNLWEETDKAALLLVTTNAVVNARGALVMGRGAAKDLATRKPEFPTLAGIHLLKKGLAYTNNAPLPLYGVQTIIHSFQGTSLGLFQVKFHWRDPADLRIIAYSAGMLHRIAFSPGYFRVAMNFPGIGNGRLDREAVLPWLANLPAHVYIYEYA